jgi:hypothetical protein
MCVFINKYYSGHQIKDKKGGACGLYEGDEECMRGLHSGNLKEKDQLEDIGIDGIMILKWFKKNRICEHEWG